MLELVPLRRIEKNKITLNISSAKFARGLFVR